MARLWTRGQDSRFPQVVALVLLFCVSRFRDSERSCVLAACTRLASGFVVFGRHLYILEVLWFLRCVYVFDRIMCGSPHCYIHVASSYLCICILLLTHHRMLLLSLIVLSYATLLYRFCPNTRTLPLSIGTAVHVLEIATDSAYVQVVLAFIVLVVRVMIYIRDVQSECLRRLRECDVGWTWMTVVGTDPCPYCRIRSTRWLSAAACTPPDLRRRSGT